MSRSDDRIAPVGGELKRVARQLHDALDRMEQAFAESRARGVSGLEPLQQENQSLAKQTAKLKDENNAMGKALAEMKKQNEAVSKQVADVSGRLELLITRLANLLAE